jgi:hypothetical protein
MHPDHPMDMIDNGQQQKGSYGVREVHRHPIEQPPAGGMRSWEPGPLHSGPEETCPLHPMETDPVSALDTTPEAQLLAYLRKSMGDAPAIVRAHLHHAAADALTWLRANGIQLHDVTGLDGRPGVVAGVATAPRGYQVVRACACGKPDAAHPRKYVIREEADPFAPGAGRYDMATCSGPVAP